MDGRGAITETKKYMIMNDAYNASPESMENAFLNFSKRPGDTVKYWLWAACSNSVILLQVFMN